MNVAFLTNNDNSLRIADHISSCGDDVKIYRDEISIALFEADEIDFAVSFGYRRIVRREVIEAFRGRIINMHISLLPWNRGADPNIWSFVDRTPKGVTIHEMDRGVDTGDIIAQRELIFDGERETLRSSYAALHDAIFDLFVRTWPMIRVGGIAPTPQVGIGSSHKTKELDPYRDLIDLDIPAAEMGSILAEQIRADRDKVTSGGGYGSDLRGLVRLTIELSSIAQREAA